MSRSNRELEGRLLWAIGEELERSHLWLEVFDEPGPELKLRVRTEWLLSLSASPWSPTRVGLLIKAADLVVCKYGAMSFSSHHYPLCDPALLEKVHRDVDNFFRWRRSTSAIAVS